MAGNLFGTFIINELIKSYSNAGEKYDFQFFIIEERIKRKEKLKQYGKHNNNIFIVNIENRYNSLISLLN